MIKRSQDLIYLFLTTAPAVTLLGACRFGARIDKKHRGAHLRWPFERDILDPAKNYLKGLIGDKF